MVALVGPRTSRGLSDHPCWPPTFIEAADSVRELMIPPFALDLRQPAPRQRSSNIVSRADLGEAMLQRALVNGRVSRAAASESCGAGRRGMARMHSSG
jgi:hypothetical protein